MATGSQDLDKDIEIGRVSVKIPPFWPNNAKLFFFQVEANFSIAKITNEVTKFNTIVAALDSETLMHVSDIVFKPPTENPYTVLKNRLISEFELSEGKKIKTLLQDLDLGDAKPSQLLRKMQDLAENKVTNDFLKSIWLNRLPSHIQTILAISSDPLPQLASIADKIAEVTDSHTISNIKIDSDNSRIAHLESEIDTLTQAIQNIEINSRSRTTFRAQTPYRCGQRSSNYRRSNSRNLRNRPNNNSNKEFCWYHFRFGNNAKKCNPPCQFKSSAGTPKN